jgi:hypothetical protein
MFYIDIAATDVQIITDGTDKFTGAAMNCMWMMELKKLSFQEQLMMFFL